MTVHSKDNLPDDPNLAKLKDDTEELRKISETAGAARDAIVRHTKKEVLKSQIQAKAIRVSELEREASVLRDATEARRRLADEQRELAELRAQLKREFPETERRWWHTLLFWRKF